MQISFKSSGSFDKTEKFLAKIKHPNLLASLEHFGQEGVNILEQATPKESGVTAGSWTYTVVKKRGSYAIYWSNTHLADGMPIALLLQYGHGTGTGGYVQGRDYINPAMQPFFDRMAAEAWKVVNSA